MSNQQLEGSLEENVLTMLAWHNKHAPELILRIEPDIFSTKAYRDIAEAAFEHIQKFSAAPRAHIWDLLEAKLRRGDEGKLLRTTLDAMQKLESELQPDFVLGQLDHFIDKRRLIMAIELAADAAHAGNLDEARAALVIEPHVTDDAGVWLSDGEAMTSFLEEKETDFFSIGIDELDKRGVVPARGTMVSLIAPPKKGKSWWCINVGKANVQHRRSVLHISLENSRDITAKRYIQAFFGMPQNEIAQPMITEFIRDAATGTFKGIERRALNNSPDALSLENRSKITKRLNAYKNRARLLIKAFPSGTLTIPMLNAYLDRLERIDNFKPDVIIIDYPDLMAVDRKNMRLDLGRIFVDIRGIGCARNAAMICPTQGGRSSDKAKVVTSNDVAEDFSKVMTADIIMTYSRTPAEKRLNLARIFVEFARDMADGFITLITQDYARGQFCLDSVFMNEYVSDAIERSIKENSDGD